MAMLQSSIAGTEIVVAMESSTATNETERAISEEVGSSKRVDMLVQKAQLEQVARSENIIATYVGEDTERAGAAGGESEKEFMYLVLDMGSLLEAGGLLMPRLENFLGVPYGSWIQCLNFAWDT